jgi:hypothetical protein
MSWKKVFPLHGDEDPVDLLQGRVRSFIAPGEQSALHVDLFHNSFIDEMTELAHPAPMETTVILVLHAVYHVEVPADHPRAEPDLSQCVELLEEGWLVTIPRRAINGCEPPIKVTRDLPDLVRD